MPKTCILFDLDGTLANGDHRLHYIRNQTPKDWTSYFAACDRDEPIPHMVELFLALCDTYDMFIVSGRSDEVRDKTLAWFREHLSLTLKEGDLYMRSAGDHRPDDELKMLFLEDIRKRGYEPLMAFDDRDRVVAAWRRAGIPCLQVAPGDF